MLIAQLVVELSTCDVVADPPAKRTYYLDHMATLKR